MSDSDYKFEHELTEEEFLSANHVVLERVQTPELKPGSYVYVRSINAAQRGDIMAKGVVSKEKAQRGKQDPFARDFDVTFVYLATCDKDGNRKFNDIQVVEKLKQKNAAVIARIAGVAQRLSGFSKKDLEELEKNSLENQQEDSLTD